MPSSLMFVQACVLAIALVGVTVVVVVAGMTGVGLDVWLSVAKLGGDVDFAVEREG